MLKFSRQLLLINLITYLSWSPLPATAELSPAAKISWHTLGLLGGMALKLRNSNCHFPKGLAVICNYCAAGQPGYPVTDTIDSYSLLKLTGASTGMLLGRELGLLLCPPKTRGAQADHLPALGHYLCTYLGAYLGAKINFQG